MAQFDPGLLRIRPWPLGFPSRAPLRNLRFVGAPCAGGKATADEMGVGWMANQWIADPAIRGRVFRPGRAGEFADRLWKQSPTDRGSGPQRPHGSEPGLGPRVVQHEGVWARRHWNLR